MGLILLWIASILKWILTPIAYLYGTIFSLLKGEFNEYNKDLAISKDQYGNGLCKYLFNHLLITKRGYKFGNINETISSVLGKNYRDKTLTKLGKFLSFILNTIDKDHVQKSINSNVN